MPTAASRSAAAGWRTALTNSAWSFCTTAGGVPAGAATPYHWSVSKLGKVRKTKIDGRTTRHAGYATSLRVRKRIEEVFGWMKVQAGLAKTKLRGPAKVEAASTFAAVACNLIRLPKLLAASPG